MERLCPHIRVVQDHRLLFIGYDAKLPFAEFHTWAGATNAPGVVEVCSVSECLSRRPERWWERLDFNGVGCYETPEVAMATARDEDQNRLHLFAYWLVIPPSDSRESLLLNLPDGTTPESLPVGPGPSDFVVLGYDVVSFNFDAVGPDHAPLSCCGKAADEAVNSYCLLDDLDRALELARFWSTDEAHVEPGEYFVVRVARRP